MLSPGLPTWCQRIFRPCENWVKPPGPPQAHQVKLLIWQKGMCASCFMTDTQTSTLTGLTGIVASGRPMFARPTKVPCWEPFSSRDKSRLRVGKTPRYLSWMVLSEANVNHHPHSGVPYCCFWRNRLALLPVMIMSASPGQTELFPKRAWEGLVGRPKTWLGHPSRPPGSQITTAELGQLLTRCLRPLWVFTPSSFCFCLAAACFKDSTSRS